MRAADELHQVGVAGLACGKKRNRSVARTARGSPRLLDRLRLALGEIDVQGHADDGLDAGVRELVGELQRAEEVVGIGEPESRQLVGCGELGELWDRERTLEQRIGGVDLEVHEFRRP